MTWSCSSGMEADCSNGPYMSTHVLSFWLHSLHASCCQTKGYLAGKRSRSIVRVAGTLGLVSKEEGGSSVHLYV